MLQNYITNTIKLEFVKLIHHQHEDLIKSLIYLYFFKKCIEQITDQELLDKEGNLRQNVYYLELSVDSIFKKMSHDQDI